MALKKYVFTLCITLKLLNELLQAKIYLQIITNYK